MLNYKTKIRMNADIASLLTENANGVCRDYLVTELNNKNNYIIYYAGIIQDYLKPTISVNAKYHYGFRDVRIEIAFCYLNNLFLIKTIKQQTKIDKEALKLDAIIDDIKINMPDLNVIGCLLTDDKESSKHIFIETNKILHNKFCLISAKEIIDKDKKIFDVCLS